MDDRKQLHALVDSLPESVLDSAEKYLQALQTPLPSKPEYPPHIARHTEKVEQIRKELEQKWDRFLKIPGSGTSGWALDRNNKMHASGSKSEHNWETGELTVRTFRVHYDFPILITERFRMRDEDRTLEYDLHVSGLGNEHGFVLQFKADGG